MPWDYAAHKARLHSDEAYKRRFYAMTRDWLRRRLRNDPDYALVYRVKRRIMARRRRKALKAEQKRLQMAIMQNTGHPGERNPET